MRLRVVALAVALIGGARQSPAQSSSGTPMMSAAVRTSADSMYAKVLARLTARGYRIDKADPEKRRLVVRPPGNNTSVEVAITPHGDSSEVAVTPLGGGGLTEQMGALITVSADATRKLKGEAHAPTPDTGELPESEWRPELFVTPRGHFWLARGGLYVADSLSGGWRLALGREGDPVDADALTIGVHMAFVGDSVAVLGMPSGPDTTAAKLYRTADGGRSWSAIPTTDLEWMDALAAAGNSVWAIGTRFAKDKRLSVFLRSDDGGVTWVRAPLPPKMNDVISVYRESNATAYAATAGYNKGPAFWRTIDAGATWSSVPTPHDQGVNKIPSYGGRIDKIARVGSWLVVREYGKVFATHADSIHWRSIDGIDYIAADQERDQLFALTSSLQAVMLDKDLNLIWQTNEYLAASRPSEVEQVLSRAGVGYVSTSHGKLYEARDSTMREVKLRRAVP
jgi:hypothetical protein